MTDLDRLADTVAHLSLQVAGLGAMVGSLLDREAPREDLRTGAMCKLLGVTRGTLYNWEKRGFVARGHDALGEVVWNRAELIRVAAMQAGRITRQGSRCRSPRRAADRRTQPCTPPRERKRGGAAAVVLTSLGAGGER